ncbi:MAG: hypothetical protein JWO37_2022 [Acidimicrobiales bacterium]|nr:hypothetical protein [Acidimicrobiales bacterium]
MRFRRAAAAAIVAIVLAAPAAASGRASAVAATGRIRLAGQTPWVPAAGVFNMSLKVSDITDPSALEIAVTTYSRITSRSAFARTLQDQSQGSVLHFESTALSTLVVDAAGNVNIPVLVRDPNAAPDPRHVPITVEGVYPVRVELREKGGDVVDRLTTHLIYLPTAVSGPRLSVAWVVPVHASPAIGANGTRTQPDPSPLLALVRELQLAPTLPVTLAPTPETVEALTASSIAVGAGQAGADAAKAALDGLRAAATGPGRQLIAQPFVPVAAGPMHALGLDEELRRERTAGADAVGTAVGKPPDTRTWLADEQLDEGAADALAASDLPVDRLIVPEARLAPTTAPLRVTLTNPFELAGQDGRTHEAAMADASLASHFSPATDPVLAAHHLLADLAVLYEDQPGSGPRGVVVLAPRSWTPDRAFVRAAVAGLTGPEALPVVNPVTLDTFFDTVPNAKQGRSPMVRKLAPPAPSDLTIAHAAEAQKERRRIEAFAAMTEPANPLYQSLDRRLLVAESADLHGARARAAYLNAVGNTLDKELAKIELPHGRSLTLTSRRAQIPLTFHKGVDYPVRVVIRFTSDKLRFPSGRTQAIELRRANTVERIPVEALTSGTFPVKVELESPDGTLRFAQAKLTVRSTATSGVGLFLSAGAALFLAVWWARHLHKGRRARRLVPA